MKSYRGLKLLPLTAMAVISIYALGSVKGSTLSMPTAQTSSHNEEIDTVSIADIDAANPGKIDWDSVRKWTPTPDPIMVLARSYGDSVVLRWAIKQYPNFLYLSRTGIDILRMDEKRCILIRSYLV